MSEKEAKDYFEKLMNDTQNQINNITIDIGNSVSELNENVKIDNSEENLKHPMSEERPKKSKIIIATLKMPDGKEIEIPLPPKVFKTGREGYYAQITAFVYDDEVYGGQIQVWKKTPKTSE